MMLDTLNQVEQLEYHKALLEIDTLDKAQLQQLSKYLLALTQSDKAMRVCGNEMVDAAKKRKPEVYFWGVLMGAIAVRVKLSSESLGSEND